MNDYAHALVKEVAAQQLGYLPSHVWGKIGKREKLTHPKIQYEHIMTSQTPEEISSLGALKQIKKISKAFISSIPDRSHIQKKNIQGL